MTMIDEILVCLDGSALAETIIPLAQGMGIAQRATLTLFRVVQDAAGFTAEVDYLRDMARRFEAQIRFAVSTDPAQAIIDELGKSPRALAAMTTHGRTAWAEAILGGVALRVLRGSEHPIILYRPLGSRREAPKKITTVCITLDGSEFAEKIIPFGVEAAKAMAAELRLIQALPVTTQAPALSEEKRSDLMESSYLHWQAREIKKIYKVDAQWDVLHGDAADAICRYVANMPETLLAMTTHGRGAVQRAVLGSVAGRCIRHAGCPILLQWPHH